MLVDGVRAQAYQLNASLCELRLELRKCAQLGRADWGEVFGMREENDPSIAWRKSTSIFWEPHARDCAPMNSWKLILPFVVSASKLGATVPRRSGSGRSDIFYRFARVSRLDALLLRLLIWSRLSSKKVRACDSCSSSIVSPSRNFAITHPHLPRGKLLPLAPFGIDLASTDPSMFLNAIADRRGRGIRKMSSQA